MTEHISPQKLRLTAEALREVTEFSEPADVVIRRFLQEHPKLGLRDRGFIAETVFSVLRNRYFLEGLIQNTQHDITPFNLVIVALVRLQGFSINSLSPHISRQQAEWIKLIKAIARDSFPNEVQTELPTWVISKLTGSMSESEIVTLGKGFSQPAPLDLRVNSYLAKRDEILRTLRDEGLSASETKYSPIGIRLATKPALNRHPLFTDGKIEVQDEGSQLLGYLVAPRRNEMLVDFCAGAGGKTLMLGAMMQSRGRIYAFDISERRLSNLKTRLKRSGLSNVSPQLIDSEHDQKIKRLIGKIDKVLIDAPCSGLGTLRRNPDLKWRQSAQAINELKQKQASILASAARLVKSGGRIIYATCSILKEENEDIVTEFLNANKEYQLLNCADIFSQQNIQLDTGTFMRTFPHIHHTDAFFAAVMQKS